MTEPYRTQFVPRLLVLLVVPVPSAWAQAAADPAVPRPARERLAAFEGSWTRTDLEPGHTFLETCGWLSGGRRHMVCRQLRGTSSGPREQLVTYSYRGADSTYLATVLLSGGQVWRYEGRLEGDRWVLSLVSSRPDAPLRLRQVVAPAGDTIRFREEVSEDGGPWRLSDPREEYQYVRVRLSPR